MVLAASGPGEFDPNFKVTRGIPLKAGETMIIKGYEKFIRENIAGPFLFTPAFTQNNPDVVQKLADAFWDNHPPLKFYPATRNRSPTASNRRTVGRDSDSNAGDCR